MDKQPVGQLPDLTQSNNDDEIMVITNPEYNQLKKEKISDFITDLTSTDENNALIKGTDNKLFVTDFGNADNITEGTLPASVLPEIPLEKIPNIPKDKLPQIETADLPNSGVTAGKYIYPTNMQVNSKGQIVSVENGVTADITKEQIDTVAARPLSDNACTQENFPDEYSYWVEQAHSTFDLSKFEVVGSPSITDDGVVIIDSTSKSVRTKENINTTTANNLYAEYEFVVLESDGASKGSQFFLFNYAASGINGTPNIQIINSNLQLSGGQNTPVTVNTHYRYTVSCTNTANNNTVEKLYADDVLILNQTSTKNWRQNNPIWFGKSYTSSSMIAVLLPKIRVWVDDKPVFSGNKTGIDTINDTLEIPYTETTDGTKIVDAAYFDRVQSCCEQTGQALYLTLDEQNQQFYLPQGTVSGMISQNKQKIDELDTTLTADILQAMPVGASIAYEGTTAPEGWFAENGLEVQKSEYPKLYAVVGDKYNLETTQEGYFRLPDTNVSSRFYEGSTTPGTLKDAGLPNIKATGTGFGASTVPQSSGAAYSSNVQSENISGGSIPGFRIDFQASHSNGTYGKSTTVQPKSITKFFIIKHD